MTEAIILVLVVILFGNVIFVNLVGPFIVWKQQTLPARVAFMEIPAAPFLAERDAEFMEYDRQVQALGFVPVACACLPDTHNTGWFRLYWQAERQIAAIAAYMENDAAPFTCLEMVRAYADDTCLTVNNAPMSSPYPRLDYKLGFRFPGLAGAAELLGAFEALCDRFKHNAAPIAYRVEQGFDDAEAWLAREADALLGKGIVRAPIDARGHRSLTLAGAFLLTYRSVNPGLKLWNYLTEKRSLRALGEM